MDNLQRVTMMGVTSQMTDRAAPERAIAGVMQKLKQMEWITEEGQRRHAKMQAW